MRTGARCAISAPTPACSAPRIHTTRSGSCAEYSGVPPRTTVAATPKPADSSCASALSARPRRTTGTASAPPSATRAAAPEIASSACLGNNTPRAPKCAALRRTAPERPVGPLRDGSDAAIALPSPRKRRSGVPVRVLNPKDAEEAVTAFACGREEGGQDGRVFGAGPGTVATGDLAVDHGGAEILLGGVVGGGTSGRSRKTNRLARCSR